MASTLTGLERAMRAAEAAAGAIKLAGGQNGEAVLSIKHFVEGEIADFQRQRARKRRNGRAARKNGRQTTSLRPGKVARGR